MNKQLSLVAFIGLFLGAFMVMLFLSESAFAKPSAESDSSFDFIDSQLVVSVEEDSDINSMQRTDNTVRESSQLDQNGFQVKDSLLQSDGVNAMSDDFKSTVVDHMGMVYLIDYSEGQYKNIDEAKEKLKQSLESMDLEVRYIQGNYTVHALEQESEDVSPADINPNQEWNYDMIKAPNAWDTTSGSENTKIAVLDTGIDNGHKNLSDFVNTEAGKSFVGGDTSDDQGHGTHVSGTIASYGDVSGVMQESTLIPVKVLDENGSGSMYDIQEGITYAASKDADVINMSLGGGGADQGMEEAIEMASDDGTIVVAASGNEGEGNVSYPAAYDDAVAVGSVGSNESRSDFSNYGEELDVMAPGEEIYSTVPDNS